MVSEIKKQDSPKERILTLIKNEGINVRESFNLSLFYPNVGGNLEEKVCLDEFAVMTNSSKAITSVLVPKFTDMNEKEQAIDLAYLLAVYMVRKEKKWLRMFSLNSYITSRIAWKKAEEICIEQKLLNHLRYN
ncbi:hypothetical protein [Bacillus cytotoxicus]|uniref:hypothetical protein n=1 Tax=Bacillus cytotoxicus TaxID=580165 RepID=UPI001AEEDF89|nr:hypothetical protein [Bacillus cytotoxicus]QTR81067.1 hypothetical protein JC773_21695 [Bacillus cytotoxicus]